MSQKGASSNCPARQWGRAGRVCSFILIALCLSWLVGCRQDGRGQRTRNSLEAPKKAVPPAETVRASIPEGRIVWADPAHKVLEAGFKQATAIGSEGSSRAELRDVTATLYMDGKAASTLTAPSARIDSETREIAAMDGARLVSLRDGSILSANKLVWKARENKLVGSGNIVMSRGNMKIAGASLTADTRLQRADLTDGEIRIKD